MDTIIIEPRKTKEPIVFQPERYGDVKLRVHISLYDYIFLQDALKVSDPRTFTVQTLNRFCFQAPREEFSTWDDETLLDLAGKWKAQALNDDGKIKEFEDLEDAVRKYISAFAASIKESVAGITKNTVQAMAAIISESLKPSLSAMTFAVMSSFKDFGAEVIRSSLISASLLGPQLQEYFKSIQDSARESNEFVALLKSSGYEHAGMLLEDGIRRELLKVRPDRRHAAITKKLVDITTGYEFAVELERLFTLPQLHGRWTAMKQALTAHQTHQYFVSAPVFLAQMEGIFTELLIERNLAYKEKTKIVALKNGEPERNRKEKIKGLYTLSEKVTHAKGHFNDERMIMLTADVLVGRFTNRRNDILHGRINNYGNARTSTQVLLLVHFLASIIESDMIMEDKSLKDAAKASKREGNANR